MRDNRRLPLRSSVGQLTVSLVGGVLALIALALIGFACSGNLATAPRATLPPVPTQIATIPIQPSPTVEAVEDVSPIPTMTPPKTPDPTATTSPPAPSATTAVPAPATTSTVSPGLAATLAGLSSFTAAMRGLEPRGEVSQVFVTDAEMSERIRAVFEEEVDQEEVERDRRIMVLLGLLEPDLDLFNTYADVYSEQVVGYYSPDDKEMVMSKTSEGLSPGDRVTYVHEYTHALQDQHFNLSAADERLEEEGNGDASAAFDALVEGDATLAMSAYAYVSLTDEEFDQLGGSDGDSPAFDEAPEFLQAAFLFPYEQGVEFAAQLFEEGGWDAIDEAFRDPPRSTEHILHFEKYLNGEEPLEVTLGELDGALRDDWSEKDNDTLGEFVLFHMLKVFLSEDRAREAAEGWGGDRYAYYEDDAGQRLLVLSTRWDSELGAAQFYEAYTSEAYVSYIDTKTGGDFYLEVTHPEGLKSVYFSDQGALGIQRASDAVSLVLAPTRGIALEVLASLHL